MRENMAKHVRYFIRGLQITYPTALKRVLKVIVGVIVMGAVLCFLASVVFWALFLFASKEIPGPIPMSLCSVLVVGHFTFVTGVVLQVWNAGKADLEERENTKEEPGVSHDR